MKPYIVDAFAEELFTGNPAAILPCKAMPAAGLMQKIAIENQYSETAFVVRKGAGHYDLKWYTPGGEIDLCGHATLGAAFVIYNYFEPAEELHFHTLSGELIVTKDTAGYTLDFPRGKIKPVPVTGQIQKAAANLAVEAYYDGGDMVVLVPDETALKNFVPDSEQIRAVDGLGLILTAQSDTYDFVSRCFYPKLNVLEDAVTGRAHTFLAPIWAEKLGKTTMVARQISERGGILTVRLTEDRVFLTGNVQLFMDGDIPFDL